MGVLEATGKRPSSLDMIWTALGSMPPTSTEAERAFSFIGLYITKLRTRLIDKLINNLFIMRNHFLAELEKKA
jgi:hypothetical protein